MRPPLLGLFPKVVPAPGDCFHGKHIPVGTSICMNVSAILRSQALFGADVDVFRPERFLALDEKKRRDMERDVGFAFGYGQWGCAGKSIALMEINKVIFEVSEFCCEEVLY
jgi:cytochrome P450